MGFKVGDRVVSNYSSRDVEGFTEKGTIVATSRGRFLIMFDNEVGNVYGAYAHRKEFGSSEPMAVNASGKRYWSVDADNIKKIGVKATNLARRMYPNAKEVEGYLEI